MKSERIVSRLLFFATLGLALPASPQNTVAPMQPSMAVAASEQGTWAKYQCRVTTKNGAVEQAVIAAESQDAAQIEALKRFGPASMLMDISCVRSTDSKTQAPAPVTQQALKTRSPTPQVFDLSRAGIEFDKDGSCRLTKEAIPAYPDASRKCRPLPDGEGLGVACPADYCARFR